MPSLPNPFPSQISDGINSAKVLPPNTLPLLSDSSVVVSLSPNSLLPQGAATQTTLTNIKAILQQQLDITASIWTDDSSAFYYRREVYDPNTQTYTITYTDPSGAPATPGIGLRPASGSNYQILDNSYDAIAGGTGYAIDDTLLHVAILNTGVSPPVIAGNIWINLSSGLVIAAPTPGTYQSSSQTDINNIAASTSSILSNQTNGTQLTGLVAGSALIGKVGIDQTTPGVTNGVVVNNSTLTVVQSSGSAIRVTDGTNTATVKAASTAALDADTSIVVQISPNSPALSVNVIASTTNNRSGTITTGGVSQQLAAANASRKRLLVQNGSTATESIFINWGAVATTTPGGGSYEILPGGVYDSAGATVANEAVNIIAATTAHAFTAKEW